MARFVALYTVGVDIEATNAVEAASVAKDFRRSIGIGSGAGYPRGIPVAVRDDTLTVVVNKVYEP
jgi:16S rRNA G527 N7-methylase RsmG